MNPEIKDLWLTALRSGDYKQAQSRLGQVEPDGTTSHCCLGVLCEVTHQPKIILNATRIVYDGDGGYISQPEKKFDLSKDAVRELARLNDIDGKSFSEIADWIEKNL